MGWDGMAGVWKPNSPRGAIWGDLEKGGSLLSHI